MERLLWFIFIRWSRNVAIGCVISFLHLHTVWKKKTWIVWPSSTRETCEGKRVPEAVCSCLSWRTGEACPHPEKDVHNQNTSVLRAPILLQTWGEALCCWCIRSSCRVQWDWGVQEVHTHSPDFQLLVSGQHSGIKLELLPYDKQAPATLKKCRQRAASFTHLLLQESR